jgi:hypothetical protein
LFLISSSTCPYFILKLLSTQDHLLTSSNLNPLKNKKCHCAAGQPTRHVAVLQRRACQAARALCAALDQPPVLIPPDTPLFLSPNREFPPVKDSAAPPPPHPRQGVKRNRADPFHTTGTTFLAGALRPRHIWGFPLLAMYGAATSPFSGESGHLLSTFRFGPTSRSSPPYRASGSCLARHRSPWAAIRRWTPPPSRSPSPPPSSSRLSESLPSAPCPAGAPPPPGARAANLTPLEPPANHHLALPERGDHTPHVRRARCPDAVGWLRPLGQASVKKP